MDEKIKKYITTCLNEKIGLSKRLIREEEINIERTEKGEWCVRPTPFALDSYKRELKQAEDALGEFSILLYGKEKKIEELEGQLSELKNAINSAQENNTDEVHCSCVPLLKVKIRDLEARIRELEENDGM